jgi:hypothetical protein
LTADRYVDIRLHTNPCDDGISPSNRFSYNRVTCMLYEKYIDTTRVKSGIAAGIAIVVHISETRRKNKTGTIRGIGVAVAGTAIVVRKSETRRKIKRTPREKSPAR